MSTDIDNLKYILYNIKIRNGGIEMEKKEEEMPPEAKLLLEMMEKSGENGVSPEEMMNTPLGDLFHDPNGLKWIKDHKKWLEEHKLKDGEEVGNKVRITEKDLINSWVIRKKREGEEVSEILKRISGGS